MIEKTPDSIPGRGNEFVPSAKCPYRPWESFGCLFNG